MWFDGANGGDGYYGGANEERRIDRASYYDWPNTWALVKSLQPGTLIFSDAGPDIRWTGNENGFAGVTNWSTIDAEGIVVGAAASAYLNRGDPGGAQWVVPLCNTSIRPGWFYHEAEDRSISALPLASTASYCKSPFASASASRSSPSGRASAANGARSPAPRRSATSACCASTPSPPTACGSSSSGSSTAP